jgi:hypothetical protein
MVKYFELSLKYCLNMEDQNAMIKRFNELFADFVPGFDIVNLAQEMSPLGFDQLIKEKEKK